MFIDIERSGKAYWLEKEHPDIAELEKNMIEKLLYDIYHITAKSIEKTNVGAGSDTYFIETTAGIYVMKFPSINEMNHPLNEPELCQYLLDKNVCACHFIKNIHNQYISHDENGRLFHLQKFIQGKIYDWNTAPQWLLKESAENLGKIHCVLKGYDGLPEGIGAAFFKFMTPQTALASYKKSLYTAKQEGKPNIVSDLEFRIDQIQKFPDYSIDISNLTCQATHGDYYISQLICGENSINAVIDWTTACVHPVVWEVVRSFVYAAPCCSDGIIDSKQFIEYIRNYLKFAQLNEYDISIMLKLFYYQISVCDYYGQFFNSTAANRQIYLSQAILSTKLMRWFEKNIDELTDIVVKHFNM